MRYNSNKGGRNYLRSLSYLLIVAIIWYVVILTYSLYKDNSYQAKHCQPTGGQQLPIHGQLRQILPIDQHTAMIITALENGDTKVVVYDHCKSSIHREFTIVDASVGISN